MAENRIVWNAIAQKQLIDIIAYIADDSIAGAENAQNLLREKLEKIALHPEMCPKDKYKTSNDGSFRAFTIFHYRISYRIKGDEIRILAIRHTSMKPKFH